MNSPEFAIRSRRAAFNRALSDGDLGAIGPLLVENAVLVTGTDSAVIPSRKAQLYAWKQEFAAPRHYAAKWRKVRDEWVIEAEIYLTLA
ncbi:MAG: hypothetical protein DI568_08160 [Sphingomonas sp.]|nr:MAG: hypothetical protein DI568_08160 [Sphingomonas sp.]